MDLVSMLFRNQFAQEKREDLGREKLLGNPAEMDKFVAGITDRFSTRQLDARAVKRFASPLDAVEDANRGTAMEGFGREFRERFTAELARPENANYAPSEIAGEINKYMLTKPAPGDSSGKPRLLRNYEEKRLDETSMPFFSKGLRTPSAMEGLPDYETWKQASKVDVLNDPRVGQYDLAEHMKSTATAATFGAAVMGGLGALPTAGTGALPSAILGGASAGLVEAVAYPIRKVLDRTEWGSTRLTMGNWVDTAKVRVAGFIPELAGGIKLDKMLARGFTVDSIVKQAVANPSAKNLLLADGGGVLTNVKADEIKAWADTVVSETSLAGKKQLGVSDEVKEMVARFFGTKGPKEIQAANDALAEAAMKRADDVRWEEARNVLVKGENEKEAAFVSKRAYVTKQFPKLTPEEKIEALASGDIVKGIDQQLGMRTAKQLVVAPEKMLPKVEAKATKDAVEFFSKTKPEDFKYISNEINKAKPPLELPDGADWGTVDKWLTAKKGTTEFEQLDNWLSRHPVTGKREFDELDNWLARPVLVNELPTEEASRMIKEAFARRAAAKSVETSPAMKAVIEDAAVSADAKAGLELGTSGVKEAEKFAAESLPQNLTKITADDLTGLSKEDLGVLGKELEKKGSGMRVPAVKDKAQITNEWLSFEDSLVEKYGVPKNGKKVVTASDFSQKEIDSIIAKSATPEEKAMLDKFTDDFNNAPEAVEEAVQKIVKTKSGNDNVTPVNYTGQGAMNELENILNRSRSGELPANEAIKAIEDVSAAVNSSSKIISDEVSRINSTADTMLTNLKNYGKLSAFFAMTGVGAWAIDAVAPDQSEASILSMLGKMVPGAVDATTSVAKKELSASANLMKETLMKAGHVVPDVVEGQVKLETKGFMKGLGDVPGNGPTEFLKLLKEKKAVGESGVKLWHQIMLGPYQQFNVALKSGIGKMLNPAVHKLSYTLAEFRNISNANKVMSNIFKEAGLVSEPTRVMKHFEPLIPKMRDQVTHDYYMDRLKELDDGFALLKKKKFFTDEVDAVGKRVPNNMAKAEAIRINRGEYAGVKDKIKELAPAMEDFHKEYAKYAEIAARDMPSVRVALALGDDANFTKYPFLKNIAFSEQEKLAVGRLREQLAQYVPRIKEVGGETISGPYLPHILHPAFKKQLFEGAEFGSDAMPFMKMYSRGLNSRPLLPDIHTTMRSYVSDTERRIQNMAFWKSGWGDVMRQTQGIPSLNRAFNMLVEGSKPVENTFGNRVANMYGRFETVRLLWMNPSAGLKHLAKLSGDIVSTGPGEVASALPDATKNIIYRAKEMIPGFRTTLRTLGVNSKTQQDIATRSYMNSLIPARDMHQRLLELGIDTYDDVLTAGGRLMNKVENAGSVWINMAEVLDRGVSSIAGLNMAAKKGMTAEQGLYGALDIILKNNFMGREFNPAWMRSPAFRSLFLFQGTPFKILERRLVMGAKSINAVKPIAQAFRSPEGRAQLMSDLKDLRRYMTQAEREVKANILIDAVKNETDFFGGSTLNQFAKDVAIIGAATYGGASVGLNLTNHFFHVPFIKGYENEGPTAAVNPLVGAMMKSVTADKEREDNNDFLFTKLLKNWLGDSYAKAMFPSVVTKINRISKNDVPEVYRGSNMQYLFSIPSKDDE